MDEQLWMPVRGANLMDAGAAMCLVDGALRRPLTVVNESFALCAVPAVGIGPHNVSLSNDGVHFSATLQWTVLGTRLCARGPSCGPRRLTVSCPVGGGGGGVSGQGRR